MALLKSQDNVSVEKIPDTIRNVMRMYIGMHIDVVTMKFLSTSSSSAQLEACRNLPRIIGFLASAEH